MPKQRIDNLIVARGLTESRTKAQALIMAGEVSVAGRPVVKPGTLVTEDAEIVLQQPPPFVSRGGLKLDYALHEFGLDVAGKVAADIGASTGGFTDCLLKHGATRVYAVDVGYGQLDYRLRQDKRVVVMEQTNARYPLSLPEKVDLATLDLSFISLEKVIPSIAQILKDDGYLVVLLKPQFEAKRKEVGKGGIIKDKAIHALVIGRFVKWLTDNNFRLGGLVASPVFGASGNTEFLVLLKR
ncbi:MAG: TlyA family RNA methyltransferase [Dehalococcoidales bacterium]|nr:TlyA family RNA methyltransferase [Dehalococcoidales bacterium]